MSIHRLKSIVLLFTILVVTPLPNSAEASWWDTVTGTIDTGLGWAYEQVGLNGLAGVMYSSEDGKMSVAAAIVFSGVIEDVPPWYLNNPEPDFCPDGTLCMGQMALLYANYQPGPLTGLSPATDNLISAMNDLDVNQFLIDARNGEPLDVLKADLRAMATQMDTLIVYWDVAEAEAAAAGLLPADGLFMTQATMAEVRGWVEVNGLPAPEVKILKNAGLTSAEIDSVTALNLAAMDIVSLVQPVTAREVLQQTADAYRQMGAVTTAVGDELLRARVTLAQNSPNPFNPRTSIEYNMPIAGKLSIGVYDVRGQLVKTLLDRQVSAGLGTVVWQGDDRYGSPAPAGVYFYRLLGANQDIQRKMVLLK